MSVCGIIPLPVPDIAVSQRAGVLFLLSNRDEIKASQQGFFMKTINRHRTLLINYLRP
jgi:hypothetical protein